MSTVNFHFPTVDKVWHDNSTIKDVRASYKGTPDQNESIMVMRKTRGSDSNGKIKAGVFDLIVFLLFDKDLLKNKYYGKNLLSELNGMTQNICQTGLGQEHKAKYYNTLLNTFTDVDTKLIEVYNFINEEGVKELSFKDNEHKENVLKVLRGDKEAYPCLKETTIKPVEEMKENSADNENRQDTVDKEPLNDEKKPEEPDGISVSDNVKRNTLYYGVPGAGKSHTIDALLSTCGQDDTFLEGQMNEFGCNNVKEFKEKLKKINEKRCERVVFHPDYTYSDFVGQLLPQNGEKLEYKFVEGPFTRILKKAVENESKNYFLIIEEINRGNAPAIFGDIFQLLDRDEEGRSRYEITNKDISDKVCPNGKVYLPKNLYILATMNTSDQNVFTLDTAFKRRWAMRCIKNDFSKFDCKEKINGSKITWPEFAKVINECISENSSGISSEDKRLGVFFVSKDELKDKTAFGEKVLMYLWDDAFKYSRDNLFRSDCRTLEDVLDKYEAEGFTAIFTDAINNKLNESVKADDNSVYEVEAAAAEEQDIPDSDGSDMGDDENENA